MIRNLLKVFRFYKIYGFSRTIYKLTGRYRVLRRIVKPFEIRFGIKKDKYRVAIVGCGQFAFATVGYFLRRSGNYKFVQAYDPDEDACESFCEFYGVGVSGRGKIDFDAGSLDLVYIASNHASHTDYAIRSLERGIATFVEKPLSVNWDQFRSLGASCSNGTADLFVGYNRPFSKAIHTIKELNSGDLSPFTLSCFVVGHFIESDHWYRHPEEGTRVCGNLGHWLDLSVHLLFAKNVPEFLDIRVSISDADAPDDNISVTMTSSHGDLINLTLTSRAEPFEGINETISYNQSDLIATIIDFREARFWKNHQYIREIYRPKDVGHKKAILQHLNSDQYRRNIEEIRISTALMLEVKEMVLSGDSKMRFFLNDERYCWKAE